MQIYSNYGVSIQIR